MSDISPEQEFICSSVAEGQTLRQIAAVMGTTAGNVFKIATANEAGRKRYTSARDAASDLFEADILEAVANVTAESAAADRIKIDALKWIAARRAPKRYGDRVLQEHVSPDGSMSPKDVSGAVLEALARKHGA